jgi:hypothetical protein
MHGAHHGGPDLSGDLRGGHERHAFGRHHPRSYFDYGSYNGCPDYPPYYRPNPWSCYQ